MAFILSNMLILSFLLNPKNKIAIEELKQLHITTKINLINDSSIEI